jgi:superfamily II DNA helicase RecQ
LLSRKEGNCRVLQVNGTRAVLYHAGLDAKPEPNIKTCSLKDVLWWCDHRFGMGIDKPDVRFVIRMIFLNTESYYQETVVSMVAKGHVYYSYKDVEKLENSCRNLPNRK